MKAPSLGLTGLLVRKGPQKRESEPRDRRQEAGFTRSAACSRFLHSPSTGPFQGVAGLLFEFAIPSVFFFSVSLGLILIAFPASGGGALGTPKSSLSPPHPETTVNKARSPRTSPRFVSSTRLLSRKTPTIP